MLIKPANKLCLSISECADYTNLGENRIRQIISDNPTLDWILHIGAHLKIKRPLFERWLDNLSYV